jgi:myosin heavy subunit
MSELEAVAEPVVEETPAVEQLPEEAPIENSFGDAIDRAMDSLDKDISGETQETEPEAEVIEEGNEESPESYDEPLPGDDLDSELTDWTPKAAKRFKQLKEERKQYRSEIDDLRQKTDHYETKIRELSGGEDSIEALQERIAEYENDRMINNLEKSSAYQEAIDIPLRETVASIESLATQYDLDADEIIELVSEENVEEPPETNPDGSRYVTKDERLESLLATAPLRIQAELLNQVKYVDEIFDRQRELFQNAEEALREAELVEEERRNHEAFRRSQERSIVTKNVLGRIQEKIPFIKDMDGVDMEALTEEVASVDPLDTHLVDQQYAFAVSKLFPSMVREYLSLQRELETVTDRLSDYEDAEPGSGSTVRGSMPSSNPSSRGEGGFLDRVNAALGG